jgi:hypothetical protein
MDPLPPPLAFFLLLVSGWIDRHQQAVIDYLLEENLVLRVAHSQTLVYERLTEDDIRVKVYGATAVVTGRTDQRVRFGSDVNEGRTRYTRVYVKRNGHWQIVAAQRTDIAPQKCPDLLLSALPAAVREEGC